MSFLLAGRLTHLVGGAVVEMTPGVRAFWAGLPHGIPTVDEGTEYLWACVPMPWFLDWGFSESLNARLLRGDVLEEPVMTGACIAEDELMVRRWIHELAPDGQGRWQRHLNGTDDPGRRMLLEVEARLRRIVSTAQRDPGKRPSRQSSRTGVLIEQATRFASLHYTDAIAIGDIAAAIGVNPKHLMRDFKRSCGIGLWEYVLRLRVAHAQRMLTSTTANVLEVAMASGFESSSLFYATFRRFCQTTPSRFRQGEPTLPIR